MNARKKDDEELNQITESLSHDTDTPPRPKGFTRFLKPILITVLSVLCLLGGIVLHKTPSREKEYTQPIVAYQPITKQNQLNILSKKVTEQKTNTNLAIVKSVPATTPEKKEMGSLDNTILTTGDTKSETQDIIQTSSNETPVKTQQPIGFTLKEALDFKEHFLTEDSCHTDYQKLLNLSDKTKEVVDVLNDLAPYCLSNQKPVKNLREAFLKDKKEALIVYYKENNPAWLAYLKAIPASLIEIRKINPQANKPKDILYKAQNEILSQNVSKAIEYVTMLPLSMQRKMNNFYREAAIYNRAKNSLDQLILSFEIKGE